MRKIVIFKLQNQSRQKGKILSKKVLDTQPNPRYSDKNNAAIHMIAAFMSKYSLSLHDKYLFRVKHNNSSTNYNIIFLNETFINKIDWLIVFRGSLTVNNGAYN